MKNFYTSVVELRQRFDDVVETHPYECGWADEAIFFVETHDLAPGTALTLRVQVSPDGIRWLDEGTELELTGTAFVRVGHFGGFLRLAGTAVDGEGQPVPVTVSVRLALKG
ncbi:hypothetical protein BAY61_09930 [Prauserella marina]|uniref:Uncharacterized protein n=1 Tax=Prauserella marina TaxID=530584 RepID=A0A222VMW3_9PSEU|nr:hypothetical protein [Prauserella marina]ASR35255.1 hypothetical protein BAY61_09930 [Prauserella marina]PWV84969.1 hypothetical protein DES30_101988 [Prauserella marina]SDC08021.1 hypothetical protein SAMN05421630_101348 [Prauserella marina]